MMSFTLGLVAMLVTHGAPTPEATSGSSPKADVIRIGLYLSSDPKIADDMMVGARAGLERMSDLGLDVELHTRIASPGWDGGAKRVAELLYDERVLGLIASPDTKEAHEASLVATRARVPLFHLCTDPKLLQNGIPWFFGAIPQSMASDSTKTRSNLTRSGCEDALSALAMAVRAASGERERIKEEIRRLGSIEGVLGPLRFDPKGRRVSSAKSPSWRKAIPIHRVGDRDVVIVRPETSPVLRRGNTRNILRLIHSMLGHLIGDHSNGC